MASKERPAAQRRWKLSLSSGDIDLYICLLGSDNENNMKMNEDIEFMQYMLEFGPFMVHSRKFQSNM